MDSRISFIFHPIFFFFFFFPRFVRFVFSPPGYFYVVVLWARSAARSVSFTNPTEFFYDDADSSMMASMLDIT